jgi:DNA-binding response OmpR family regulator
MFWAIYETSTSQVLSRKLLVFCQRVLARGLLNETGLLMAQKILIVEDNSDLSQLLAFYLNDAGYEISRAGNSAQGISKALAEQPNLIITDLYLPDMNAVDATIILKQDPATSGIPIVVLTAMAVGEWKTKALKAGAAKYLIKPVSPPELTEVVRTLILPPSSLTER